VHEGTEVASRRKKRREKHQVKWELQGNEKGWSKKAHTDEEVMNVKGFRKVIWAEAEIKTEY
jgi:hypothetical protein